MRTGSSVTSTSSLFLFPARCKPGRSAPWRTATPSLLADTRSHNFLEAFGLVVGPFPHPPPFLQAPSQTPGTQVPAPSTLCLPHLPPHPAPVVTRGGSVFAVILLTSLDRRWCRPIVRVELRDKTFRAFSPLFSRDPSRLFAAVFYSQFFFRISAFSPTRPFPHRFQQT